MTQQQLSGWRPLRADARANHAKILVAARDVFVERGAGAPLEEIARRAGVGIATLYRRFADRQALMRAVVLDALARTRQEGERALAEETDGFAALTRYMHAVIDVRVAAVIPALLGEIDLDDQELTPARDASVSAIQQIIDAAHADSTLPEEVTFGDIGTLLVRLSRPLPGTVPAELSNQLAHRHLDLLIEGLRPSGSRPKNLDGPALAHRDLRALRRSRPSAAASESPAPEPARRSRAVAPLRSRLATGRQPDPG
jgi:AcrR family transcriptional regulator